MLATRTESTWRWVRDLEVEVDMDDEDRRWRAQCDAVKMAIRVGFWILEESRKGEKELF